MDAVGQLTEAGAELTLKLKDTEKNALRVILERMVEEFEKQDKDDFPDLESLLSDELIESIGSEVESGVKEIINSEEVKDLKEELEGLFKSL